MHWNIHYKHSSKALQYFYSVLMGWGTTTNSALTALTVRVKLNTLGAAEGGASCPQTTPRAAHLLLINRLLNAARHRDKVETIPVTSPPAENGNVLPGEPEAESWTDVWFLMPAGTRRDEKAERWHFTSPSVSSPGSWREADGKHLLFPSEAKRTWCVLISSLSDVKKKKQPTLITITCLYS